LSQTVGEKRGGGEELAVGEGGTKGERHPPLENKNARGGIRAKRDKKTAFGHPRRRSGK